MPIKRHRIDMSAWKNGKKKRGPSFSRQSSLFSINLHSCLSSVHVCSSCFVVAFIFSTHTYFLFLASRFLWLSATSPGGGQFQHNSCSESILKLLFGVLFGWTSLHVGKQISEKYYKLWKHDCWSTTVNEDTLNRQAAGVVNMDDAFLKQSCAAEMFVDAKNVCMHLTDMCMSLPLQHTQLCCLPGSSQTGAEALGLLLLARMLRP